MNLQNRRIKNLKDIKRIIPTNNKRNAIRGLGMAQARREFALVNSFSYVWTMKRRLQLYNNPQVEREFFENDYSRVFHQASKNLQLMEHNIFWKYKQRPIKRITLIRSV